MKLLIRILKNRLPKRVSHDPSLFTKSRPMNINSEIYQQLTTFKHSVKKFLITRAQLRINLSIIFLFPFFFVSLCTAQSHSDPKALGYQFPNDESPTSIDSVVAKPDKWPGYSQAKLNNAITDPETRQFLKNVKWLYESIGNVTVLEIENRFGYYVMCWRPENKCENEYDKNYGKRESLAYQLIAACPKFDATCKPNDVEFRRTSPARKGMSLAAFQSILGLQTSEDPFEGPHPRSSNNLRYSTKSNGRSQKLGVTVLYAPPNANRDANELILILGFGITKTDH
jgi:hypothetical protein